MWINRDFPVDNKKRAEIVVVNQQHYTIDPQENHDELFLKDSTL